MQCVHFHTDWKTKEIADCIQRSITCQESDRLKVAWSCHGDVYGCHGIHKIDFSPLRKLFGGHC